MKDEMGTHFSFMLHPSSLPLAHVAQLVEHVLGKDEVTGSIPVVSSFWRASFFIGPK
jgi:hypothetical protein